MRKTGLLRQAELDAIRTAHEAEEAVTAYCEEVGAGADPDERGPDRPQSVSATIERMGRRWRDAGLNPLGFHEARHTAASMFIAAGLNAKTVSTYLGHANIAVTFDRYGHLFPGSEAEGRGLLDAFLADGAVKAPGCRAEPR
jgi:integrase